MLRITEGQLGMIKSKMESLQNRIAKAKDKANEVVGVLVRTAEIGVTAFGLSVMNAKFGKPGEGAVVVVGVPLSLGIGVALHIAGFMGLGGARGESHLHNFGDGALAEYLADTGRTIGLGWKQKAAQAQLPGGSATRGNLGDGAAGQKLTDEEMAKITARV